MRKSRFQHNHKILKKLLHKFIFFFYIMWISHIEIYSKKFRVGYRTSFPIIQLHVSSCFHGWYKWLQLSNLSYAQQGCAQVRARITLILPGQSNDNIPATKWLYPAEFLNRKENLLLPGYLIRLPVENSRRSIHQSRNITDNSHVAILF